jgi:spore protease
MVFIFFDFAHNKHMAKERFYSEAAQDAFEKSAVLSLIKKTAVSKNIEQSYVDLRNGALADQIGKKRGVYYTFDCKENFFQNPREKKRLIKALSDAIKDVAADLGKSPVVLVVGLGNEGMTADALGPKAAAMVAVTRHLANIGAQNSINEFAKAQGEKQAANKFGKRNAAVKPAAEKPRALVAAISPNVPGETGVQSYDVVRGVCDRIKPDLVVLIDTLCTSKPERLYSSFQLTTAGVSPGSGVGEKRTGFDQSSLSVPVLAIGVPLVANVGEIIKQTLSDYCQKQKCAVNYSFIERITREKLKNNFILAPKEIDYVAGECAGIIAASINRAFGNAEVMN